MKKFIIAATLLGACSLSSKAAIDNSIDFSTAEKTTFSCSVDGKSVKVDWYVDNYLTKSNRPEDQKINVYIPQNATKDSPIMFYVNNAGWRSDEYPTGTIREGQDYNGTSDKVGVALKEGYVVVSYGCRGRGNGLTDGKYLGHSPATMTDTKAAIRYLRFNKKALPAGNTDKIVITGTSGGGALSTVIAASGNSADYFPSLYEIGAAGITKNADGSYSSKEGCGDNVFAVIGYCPITDLGHACAGYEWIYKDTRAALYKDGKMSYDFADEATIMKASEELSKIYSEYLDGLNLKDENGNPINSSNLNSYIEKLMRKEIDLSIKEFGIDKMKSDVEAEIRRFGFGGPMGGGRPQGGMPQGGRPQGGMPQGGMPQGMPQGAMPQGMPQMGGGQAPQNDQPKEYRVNNGWITFNEDGSYNYDYKKHLLYLATYTTLKPAPSFSNVGLYNTMMNEDNLFGGLTDEYCPFNPYSWNNDKVKNDVGKDDTGMTWDEFMKTEKGKEIALEIKMTAAMPYILEGKSDIAPYWYVRHGMDDRDTGFAVEATLFYSIMTCPKVKGNDVGFAWLRPHSGDYDVPEAYSWLKKMLANEK